MRFVKIAFFVFLLIGYSISLEAKTVALEWEHDCSNTTGFNLYFGEESSQNDHSFAQVLCPETSIVITNGVDGYYVVKAYNLYGESASSNEILLADYYYNSVRYDYDSNRRVIYKGEHVLHNADVSDTGWTVSKYYYDSGGMITHIRTRTMAWANRTQGW